MKKDIEWLRYKLETLARWLMEKSEFNGERLHHFFETLAEIEEALDSLDQLDEPEVLSQEFIDKHAKYYEYIGHAVVPVDELQNLIMPKQDLPVVPKHVADWLDDNIERYRTVRSFVNSLVEFFGDTVPEKVRTYARENPDTMARAYLDGYTVEEEPPYYALVKGHEVIDGVLKYWNFDPRNNGLFVSAREVGRDMYIKEMSKSGWNKLGINDSNADFLKVEDVEE